ncbi:MAG: hypothetical protein RLN72_12055 [Henriciella sp.]
MKHSLKSACACLAVAAFAFGAHAAGPDDIDFGDDSSLWSNDGECDDPRFEGAGSASSLDDADIMADATDCKAAFLAGSVTLIAAPTAATTATTAPLLNAMPTRPTKPATTASGDIDYGDDDSLFSFDDECDDARFIGDAMAGPPLMADDIGHDATDCRVGMEAGNLRLRGDGDPSIEEATAEVELTEEDQELLDELAALFDDMDSIPVDPTGFDDPPADGILFNGINFGDDTSEWSNDGECDDPRFEGEGQTETTLLEADAYHDATDCLAAWKEGGLELVDF